MKANADIIKSFINGVSASNTNLRTDGDRLVNYYTCIAQRTDNGIIYNATKYSSSTSKIQHTLRYMLNGCYIPTTKHVPLGTMNLGKYI